MSAKSEAKDLTGGNLWKNIILFSLPLIASNLLQVLFNLSDMAIVGNFAENGANAMGSVGSTTMTVNLFTGFLIGLGGGINVVVATAFGAADKDGVEKSVHSAAVIAPLIGIILALLGFFGARPILSLLDTKPRGYAEEKYLFCFFGIETQFFKAQTEDFFAAEQKQQN